MLKNTLINNGFKVIYFDNLSDKLPDDLDDYLKESC